jgi:hypothetical protein
VLRARSDTAKEIEILGLGLGLGLGHQLAVLHNDTATAG